MSKSAIEALKVTGLLDKNGKAASLVGVDPSELQKRIDYYRDVRMKFADKDGVNSIPDKRDLAALISSLSSSNAVNSLLPSCFVYNRIYTNDPLVRLAGNPNEFAKVQRQSLGFDTDGLANPIQVANKLLYFEKLAPLIELGCVTVLPIEELHAPPSEGLPIFHSEDWFRSEVPAHIHDFIHQNAVVRGMEPGPNGKGLIVLDEPPSSPTRGICVEFKMDYSVSGSNFYLLNEIEILDRIDEEHFKIAQRLNWDNPPEKCTSKLGSINRSISQ